MLLESDLQLHVPLFVPAKQKSPSSRTKIELLTLLTNAVWSTSKRFYEWIDL